MSKKIYAISVLLGVLIGVNILFVLTSEEVGDSLTLSAFEPLINETQAYILPISEPSYMPILDSQVPKPVLDAKSAVVYHVESARFLFEKNAQQELPIASLTKLLSTVIVLENMDQDEVVSVTKESTRVDGLKQDLQVDEMIRVGDLMKLMLISSSNDAAYALAAHAKLQGIDFVRLMNEKAFELGMTDSLFLDPAGLNDEGHSNVRDLVKLVRYSLQYKDVWQLMAEKEYTITSADGKVSHSVTNTNQLLGVVPGIVGGKTGYTDGASGCLILLVDIPQYDDTIITVVLGSANRFQDTKALVEWAQAAYRWE